MELFKDLGKSILENGDRNAFFINSVFYKYNDLAVCISKIRKAIQSNVSEDETNIGLVANDDLETYAAIIALWFEGKAYVPLSPDTPEDRNENIIRQAGLKTIIDSSGMQLFNAYKVITSSKLPDCATNLIPKEVSDKELVYILFTSGTTGQPKGVPITRENLQGFIEAFWRIGFQLNEKERCLQMFDLTFDLSVMSYLVPLLIGACQYTIPKDKIKYAYIFELMDEQQLTFSLMVPSILHYLRQYFGEMDFPYMKYSLFCGEALPLDVTQEWSYCLPNAEIMNVYGPTEDTIFCTCYKLDRSSSNKTHNGVLSIGRAMEGTSTIIIDDNDLELPAGNKGQLCLGGIQLTPGYWHNPEKNKESFFNIVKNEKAERFYKTGDLCIRDDEGDILYLGRMDFQTKIQGFRVELSEVEFHVKAFLDKMNVAAIALTDAKGITEIGLAFESQVFDITPLLNYLKGKMPVYMLPKPIVFTDRFPLNANGKFDRKKLELLFDNRQNA